ncbi:MAG: UbiA family prenyltransferase [Pseudomonadota bacterium]
MASPQTPLVVDLDGTLIHTDLLVESALTACKDNLGTLFAVPGWLGRGKAELKRELAARAELDIATLPWNLPLLEWLRAERAGGRTLVLATASDLRYAQQVQAHLGCFDEVFASCDGRNLAAAHKRAALVERFGEGGYDYAGNAHDDLEVWRSARQAVVVNAPSGLQAQIGIPVAKVFARPAGPARAWGRALRLHQWLKNALLFLPLLAAHRFDAASWLAGALGFLAFSLCASSVYLLNDLLDLTADRHHPRKRLRPFAAGRLPALHGALLAPLLLLAALGIAFTLSRPFGAVLIAYYGLTLAYSFYLKRIAMLDVMTLAGLYTIRIVAGAALTTIVPSFWLLSFALFFFLCLAFLKRYTELVGLHTAKGGDSKGRGYAAIDAPIVAAQGAAAGYTSVLVLAFYINSAEVTVLYREPRWLWGICVLLLYWLNRSWWLAHRGRLHDDPVIYAVMDGGSRLILLAVLALLAIASLHLW